MALKLAFDRWLFAAVLLLLGLGLVMVYSASTALARGRGGDFNPFFAKQAVAAVIGIAGMLVAMHVDYRLLRRPAVTYLLVGTAFVLLVAALFAPALNNSRRWLYIGGLSIQPSELAKLALVPFIASQIERKHDRINSLAFLVPCAFVTGLLAVLILLGRDLGSAILVATPALLLVFLAGLSFRYLVAGAAFLAPATALAIASEPYRMRRLLAFLDPEKEPLGWGFQPLQSLIAVGSGGIFGLGPGNSVQKLHFLPSPHADFIFSIVAEELGFVGAVVLLGLLALLLARGVRAGLHAPDTFGRNLAWGFTALIVIQALVHVSVALSLFPTTGVTLPLVSHGGSSMVTTLVACGLVLNVSQHA